MQSKVIKQEEKKRTKIRGIVFKVAIFLAIGRQTRHALPMLLKCHALSELTSHLWKNYICTRDDLIEQKLLTL